MTEPVSPFFGTEATPEPEPAEAPAPAAEPETAGPAAPAPAEDTPAEPESAEDSTETPADAPAPFIPDTGVADWLRELLTWYHDRLTALED